MAKTAAVIATLNVSVRFVRSATTAPPNSPNSGVRNNPEEGRLYGDEAFRAASGQAQKVHSNENHMPYPRLKTARLRFAITAGIPSKADIGAPPSNVRFTPESGHWLSVSACPLLCQLQTSPHWSFNRPERNRASVDPSEAPEVPWIESIVCQSG